MIEPTLPDACWRRIGVRGDRSCAALCIHIHCHNCPVHADAARTLLDRPLAPTHQTGLTGQFARESRITALEQDRSAFVFRISDEWLGLPSDFVQEVVERRAHHSLPNRGDDAVLGLVNIRGELIVLLSLVNILGISARDDIAQAGQSRSIFARLLVAGTAKHRIALPVDEVHGVLRYNRHDTTDLPATLSEARSSYSKIVLRWQDKGVGLLDPDRLLIRLDRIMA